MHSPNVLLKRKRCYPLPKKSHCQPYRNLVEQNKWVRDNLFDAQGNYVYCHSCILEHINIHSERLVHQRKIKCSLSKFPIVSMTKKEVVKQRLEKWVLASEGIDCSFKQYWKSLNDDSEVLVKYPHYRHGLCGKSSNHAKVGAKEAFLKFVDNNSQPNGRCVGSYSAQYFFLPQFTRIDPPRRGEKGFEEKEKSSLVEQFNRVQKQIGETTISGTTARKWLLEERPKWALCPSMTDYCDHCKEFQEKISRIRATINRKTQSGNADSSELLTLQAELVGLEDELKSHKEDAKEGRVHYRHCTLACKDKWNKIRLLEVRSSISRSEVDDLSMLMEEFILVLSCDYQQAKLIPHWGESAQPGLSYYMQKVSHEVFGIVDYRSDSKHVFIFDERITPKNTDHTISLLHAYIKQVQLAYPWIKRFCIFMDNACSTNKNRYMFAWCHEMVKQGKVDYIRLAFLVPGHTKFSPDRLFSSIAHSYNRSDVFTIDELKSVCSQHATTIIEDGNGIFCWKQQLQDKYGEVSGIRKLQDMRFFNYNRDLRVLVRRSCWNEAIGLESTNVIINHGMRISIDSLHNYYERRSNLSEQKMNHMQTMYSRWVSPDRWPLYLSRDVVIPEPNSGNKKSSSGNQAPKTRKKSKCSTPGCDGRGHKNPAKQSQGHTTRAGCPIFHQN